MSPEADQNSYKYERQSPPSDSLDGMPPERRRLVVWGLWWFCLVGVLLGAALEAANVPQPWRTLLAVAALVAVFAPLIRGAVFETRELRADGIALPSHPVTRKSLISTAVITGTLWIFFVFLVVNGRLAFPLLPVVATIWLAYQWLRRRSLHSREDHLRNE